MSLPADREAFVAAIRAQPEDDGPRLVCADWFEEHGDDASVARATFIRTQIARARLASTDPQQSELESRERRLLAVYGKAWCGSHFVFKKSRFRRGFIEYVHLHLQHFLHHRRQMLALEPVRDVSLTGWMRATDDLVRRVAACEEWQHVETLRVHHQGPHKSPRSNLVILIESPHLTGLKSLRLPMLAIDADARRRLEQAPVMARLSELSLPHLDTFPTDPGPWFGGGAPPLGARWQSLQLTDDLAAADLLAQLSAAPVWKGLRSFEFSVPMFRSNEALSLLRNRMPPAIESLRLVSQSTLEPLTDADSFYARLSRTPLRRLRLDNVPISAAALSGLLGGGSRCELRDLKLLECGLTDEHLAVIASSPATQHIEHLDLSQYQGVSPAAIDSVITSQNFRSLVSLSLRFPAMTPEAIDLLASAPGWDRLRKLELTVVGTEFAASALTRFLDSKNATGLVRLAIDEDHRSEFSVAPALVERIGRLPHLARLRLFVNDVDQDVRTRLNRLRPEISATVRCHNGESVDDYFIDPNNLPPLDDDLEELDPWN